MSAFEVTGVLLGALPVLIEAVDIYKTRVRFAFQKRQYVAKLARSLFFQKQILEEIVRSVIIASGCDDISRLDEDQREYLADPVIQEQVRDFLGTKNDIALRDTLHQSNCILLQVSKALVGYVPPFKNPINDFLAIAKANQDARVNWLDILQRAKLVLGVEELKSTVEELDATTAALQRFATITVSNRQAIQSAPSEKAAKLAEALRHVRDFANALYLAISQGWKSGCHSRHEANLFLEDRVGMAGDILKQLRMRSSAPILTFQLIFAASMGQGQTLWHETGVRVFSHCICTDDDDSNTSAGIGNPNVQQGFQTPKSARVAIIIPPAAPAEPGAITFIGDLCTTIKQASCSKQQYAFVLTKNQRMGTICADKKTLITYQQADTITLKKILLARNKTAEGDSILDLRCRMLLALRLASNLLQLLQTQWLGSAWSRDVVSFHVLPSGSIDVLRPFVSLPFDGTSRTTQQHAEPKVALLELGILLLEIWHEKTLEKQFGLSETPVGYYARLPLAAEWLDDASQPLLDYYEKAVAHCIRTIIGGSPKWEDRKFRSEVCAGIIEPLSRNCKRWR